MKIHRTIKYGGIEIGVDICLTSSEISMAYDIHEKKMAQCDVLARLRELPDEFFMENGITRYNAEMSSKEIADEFLRMTSSNFSELQGFMDDAIRRLGNRPE